MATNYGLIMAGVALAAVPIVIVLLVFQNPLPRYYHGSGQRLSDVNWCVKIAEVVLTC